MQFTSVCPLSVEQVRQISPTALAYVGDAVYELWVRLYLLTPPKPMQGYHQHVVERVRAESQADQLDKLTPILTEDELDIVRRGRNAATGSPKRLKHSVYRRATGFEALIGYLYLSDMARLTEILDYLKNYCPD